MTTHRPIPPIDPDISKAATLPGWFYGDAALHDRARERIFARSWQFAGDPELVKAPGQVQPFTFLEGCVDEPLLLTRDMNDRVHCLSNVCTHRGNLVVASGGRERTLTCAYHGRRFDLDGTCRFMPEFQGVEGFPCDADHLRRLPTARLGPLIFTAIDPARPFDRLMEGVASRVAWMPLDELRFDPGRSRDYLVQANWALYCDNYLEGFHIPYVHASLNAVLDYGHYEAELFPLANLQVGIAKGGELAFDPPASSPDHGRRIAAYYFWVFPNLMLNFYPWGLSINVVRPMGPDRTKVSFLSYVMDASKLDRGAGAGLDRVEREDESVVEAVQRGVRSRIYDRGRYSPKREQGVHHFHRLLAAALHDDAPAR